MRTKIAEYDNGNVHVTRFSDGTVIRFSEDDEFNFAFPENMDIKICDRCNMGCPYCHEGSTPNGKLGDIMNAAWVDSLHPYTELAIGGGNILEHPDLVPFLKKLKDKNIYANVTLNQKHFMENLTFLEVLSNEGYIHGIGVSFTRLTKELLTALERFPNAVLHIIAGVIDSADLIRLMNHGENLKVLILGYKKLRRGQEYYNHKEQNFSYGSGETSVEANIKMIERAITWMFNSFKVVSFDCLAIEQLHVKKYLSPKVWEQFYQGDDGTMTFYIDMVNNQFAESSTASLEKRYNISDKTVDDMFVFIKNNK